MAGTRVTGINPVGFARLMQDKGAGEIIINVIEKDGTMTGYDLELVKGISESVEIPVVAAGDPGAFSDFGKAVNESYASAVSAGSMFVYHGPRKAVLINYPNNDELKNLF